MVLGNGGVEPQAIAYHISIGDGPDTLCSTDIHITTDNHRRQTLRSLLHHPFIERQLEVEQGLRQALSAFPTEHRNRRQYLATDGIRRQASALPTGMKDDTTLTVQPFLSLLQCPCGTATRA